MGFHLFKRRQKALAAFAVQAANGRAQAANGFNKLVLLRRKGVFAILDLGQFFVGAKIDGT